MSTYTKQTKHPITNEWENALWIDDYYGSHNYGVQFSDKKIYDPRATELETRESYGDAQSEDKAVPHMAKERVIYRVVHPTGEDSERTVEALVTVELPSGRVTIDKVRNGSARGRDWHFAASTPEVVRAVGEVLIAAANASKNTQDGI